MHVVSLGNEMLQNYDSMISKFAGPLDLMVTPAKFKECARMHLLPTLQGNATERLCGRCHIENVMAAILLAD